MTVETGKVILQKVDIMPKKIDWENEDEAWKEYTAKRITREKYQMRIKQGRVLLT